MKVRNRKFTEKTNEESYWPSFADVMSTFSLVMLFIVLMVFLRNIAMSISLQAEQTKLEATEIALSQREDELTEKHRILIELEELLSVKEETLILLGKQLDALEDELASSEEELRYIEEEKKNAQELLIILLQNLEEQESIIAASDRELKILRAKLEEISVMRAELFASVKRTIEEELGETNEQGLPLVEIGENANIVINEALLFDTGQANIKPEGRILLDQFAIAFENILENSEMRDIIDYIAIEGHADQRGSEFFNMGLSLERSQAVFEYLFRSNPALLHNYKRYFATSGFSEFRPIDPGNYEEAWAKNRRIEFSIIIKDNTIEQVIDDYLSQTENILTEEQEDEEESGGAG